MDDDSRWSAVIQFGNLFNKIINLEQHTYGAIWFLYAVKRVLKVIEDVWTADREALDFVCDATRVKNMLFFLLNTGPPIGSPFLFVHGAKRVKRLSVLLSKRPPKGSHMLFVRGAMRVKNISFFCWVSDRRSGCYACKKHKFFAE
jgi:hypothetical protein